MYKFHRHLKLKDFYCRMDPMPASTGPMIKTLRTKRIIDPQTTNVKKWSNNCPTPATTDVCRVTPPTSIRKRRMPLFNSGCLTTGSWKKQRNS
ncbi:hypothetical protein FKM82_026689 [Ascaphus truei]